MWRKDLDAGLKSKIAAWLFAYGKTESERKVLAELGWAPFTKSDNNQLLPIRQMEVNRSILKIKGDERMSEAERTAKLAALQKQFDALDEQIAALKK